MTVNDVIARLPRYGSQWSWSELPAPKYDEPIDVASRPRLGLAVESMRRHMTDEGIQLFDGLKEAKYLIINGTTGFGPCIGSNVADVLKYWAPSVVLIQDKREWIGKTAGPGFDQRERFTNVEALLGRDDVFKLTVVKDSQSDAGLHVGAANEIGCHAWVCYYHPKIVKHLAPFVRERHLVRTYHSVDSEIVPKYSTVYWDINRSRDVPRDGCLLSGAMSNAYPFRKKIFDWHHRGELDGCIHLPHPGYGRNGCHTPEFLKRLSEFKVAVCTSSVYGYALRKIVEATACGCRVITNLPEDDALPHIDCNLVRVGDNILPGQMRDLIRRLIDGYDPSFQEAVASVAKTWYDYRAVGKRLAADIETLRRSYNAS